MLDGTAIKELSDRFARPIGELGPLVAVPAGYALKDPTAVIEPGPKASALQVNTLDAVCDYLKANRDRVDLAGVVVHVVSPNCVKVLGPLDARSRVRETFVEATCADLTKDFIGQFRAHEEFMIGLQTRFTDLGQRPDVLRLLGSVKNEKVSQSMDDGVTQVVTARAGSVLVAEVAVPNPVSLAPYRTFRDVQQPTSLFVLRVQGWGKEGSLPGVALFEADGGAWRLDAIDKIAEWLGEHLPAGLEVLA